MKKTLLVTLEYPPMVGGVAHYYNQLVKQLDHDKLVVQDNSSGQLLPWRKAFLFIWRYIRNHNIKYVLVGQVLPLGTIVAVLSYIMNFKYAVFIHGMDISVPQQYMRKRFLLGWILKRADKIITVSSYTKNKIRTLHPTACAIEVISPGPHITPELLNSEDDQSVRHDLPERFILSVGRLVARKGFDNTILALANIQDRFPNVHYIIAGSGQYKETLLDIINSVGMLDKVHIKENLSDAAVAQLYKECELLVMPSRTVNHTDFEGFGISVIEANTFGKAAIGGKNSGMIDAIKDGETGWLVDGSDVAEISSCLVGALENREQTLGMGRQAQDWTSVNNKWTHKAKQLALIIGS